LRHRTERPHPPDSRRPGARPSGQLRCSQALRRLQSAPSPASQGKESVISLESFPRLRGKVAAAGRGQHTARRACRTIVPKRV